MDVEEPFFASSKISTRSGIGPTPDLLQRMKVPLPRLQTELHIPKTQQQQQVSSSHPEVDQALANHGLPWMTSIDPTYVPADPEHGLFYMPFFNWQMDFMKDNLTNLRVLPTESQSGEDLSYIESITTRDQKKPQPVRMVTLCFASDEYRKIRMTVYDAGNRTQVFTSLFYPDAKYNLPVLGIDLLQFNIAKHLCVVDFQPIFTEDGDGGAIGDGAATVSSTATPFEHLLKPIRDQYPSLQGKMTKRFYDEDRFFSNQMLFSRFDELQQSTDNEVDKAATTTATTNSEQHPAYRDLFPAFQQYVHTHLELLQSTPPAKAPQDVALIQQGQADYDTYSADRDPAHAMFNKVFGPDFADAFVYDVLFSFSEGKDRASAKV